MRRYGWLVVVLALLAAWAWQRTQAPAPVSQTPASMPQARLPVPPSLPRAPSPSPASDADADAWPAFLPPEAVDALQRIAHGGPYAHRQDGATFQNREHRLPPQPRGYYREYTVETPGSRDRGARRIIAGGEPPAEYFYSDDHYRSFRRFTAGARR
jgi:guanyl-specific ribonuclease Sa